MVVYVKVISVAHQLIHGHESVKDVYCAYKAIVCMHCVVHVRAPCTVNSVTLLFTVVCGVHTTNLYHMN